MKLNKILLATDLSEESESPYVAVSELARSSGASIELLHVIEDLPMPPAGAPFAPPVHTGDLPAQLASVGDVVAEHARRLGDGLEISTQVLAASNVGEAIAARACEEGFDLVALSTHGRSGFRRLVMGSVTEIVLRHCKVPVLVFPCREQGDGGLPGLDVSAR